MKKSSPPKVGSNGRSRSLDSSNGSSFNGGILNTNLRQHHPISHPHSHSRHHSSHFDSTHHHPKTPNISNPAASTTANALAYRADPMVLVKRTNNGNGNAVVATMNTLRKGKSQEARIEELISSNSECSENSNNSTGSSFESLADDMSPPGKKKLFVRQNDDADADDDEQLSAQPSLNGEDDGIDQEFFSNTKDQSKLLLVSLLENFCELYDQNPEFNKKLFYVICKQLSLLGIIEGTDFMEDTDYVRSVYKKVFRNLVIKALKSVDSDDFRLIEGITDTDPSSSEDSLKLALWQPKISDTINYYQPRQQYRFSEMVSESVSRYDDDFIEEKRIGKGGFGSVFRAQNKLDQKMYAIKKIKFKLGSSFSEKILREVKALAKLEHANIVRYHGAWIEVSTPSMVQQFEKTSKITALSSNEDDQIPSQLSMDSELKSATNTESVSMSTAHTEESSIKKDKLHLTLYIQMELCEGNLAEWLLKRNKRIDEQIETLNLKENLRIFRFIVEGVDYIHSEGLIHRDLKPQNIMFHGSGYSPKIGDFGLVTEIDHLHSEVVADEGDLSSSDRTTGIGTVTYAAPEQLEKEFYDEKADIYSLGILFFELFYPFSTAMEKAILFKELRNGKLPQKFLKDRPKEAAFTLWLTSPDPQKRPSAADILQFELIRTVDEKLVTSLEKKLHEKDILLLQKDRQLKDKDEEITLLKKKLAELQSKAKD